MASKLYSFNSSRNEEQRRTMIEMEEKGICFLCTPDTPEFPKKEPIEHDNGTWYVTKNTWPYKGSVLHLLVVPKRHVERPEHLNIEERLGLFNAIEWVNKTYDIPGGAIVMRFGECNYNGGSIYHLHFHFIMGARYDPSTNDQESLRVKIGTKHR